jgi:N-carbamoylputrescine amidase
MNELIMGLVQQPCTENREQNLAITIEGIRKAAANGARLVLLQELHTSLYFCQTENARLWDLAEPIPGPSTELLGKIAKELSIVIVASLFERRTAGIYHNTVVVFEKNGEIAGKYRKMHIPDDPGYYEKFYFTPGDLGFNPINTSVGSLGVLICWDQWYPEAARLMALRGADILLYPTAIGWGTQEDDGEECIRQRDSWILIQRSHAIANGLPVAVCNRVGFEAVQPDEKEGMNFWGSSFVVGPQGEFLAEASKDQSEVLMAKINLQRSEQVRRGWPFLRDRRTDAYQGLMARYLDS